MEFLASSLSSACQEYRALCVDKMAVEDCTIKEMEEEGRAMVLELTVQAHKRHEADAGESKMYIVVIYGHNTPGQNIQLKHKTETLRIQ